jgi:hypothetical protein
MPIPCILFAAGLDWLENLLPVLFVGFWILSQVFAVFRRVVGNGRPAQPPVIRLPVPARPEPLRPAPPRAAEGRDELEKQIEEFLRRATGEPAPKPVVRKKPVAAVKPAPSVKPPAPKPAIATDVASHVREAFAHDLKHDRSPLETPAAVHRPDAAPPADAKSRERETVGAELARALRHPAAIRKAILLREVLERPVDRW